ncbi:hypothetical protein ACPCTO_07840 [Streptomyces olivoreticuli]
MPKKKPQPPNVKPNLLHGGRASDRCPRCRNARNKKDGQKFLHSFPEVTDSENLRQVLVTVDRNLRQDKELMKDPAAVFMMGVLEAKIGNREYFFVASSGRTPQPWIQDKHLAGISYQKGKWKVVNPGIPDRRDGWWTVQRKQVTLGADIAGVTRPCSAVKLLLGLGDEKPTWNQVEYLRMSEMVYVGPKAEDTKHMRAWHGEGATNSWTAHSCDACEARIPYLICDVPDNRFND